MGKSPPYGLYCGEAGYSLQWTVDSVQWTVCSVQCAVDSERVKK